MSPDLADQPGAPSREARSPLRPEQIQSWLGQLEGWRVEDARKLVKSYKFKNFVEAVRFVNAITPIAEDQGHHPDLYVRWGEVRAYLWTHTLDGLTESDFILAGKLDRAYQSSAQPA